MTGQQHENNRKKETSEKQGAFRSKYQLKPRVLMVGDSVAHNANFRVIEKATNTTIKTAKAYSSRWDNTARFPDQNVTKVAQDELKKAKFDYLVLAAPTVDKTNIDASNIKPDDSTEAIKKKVETSCKDMFHVAERALESNSSLKEVIIMNHAPRFDTKEADPVNIKPKLATFANNLLEEKWLESSYKNRIHVGSHELPCVPGPQQKKLYADQRDGNYDGIHLYGAQGKQAFTHSVTNILLSSVEQPTQSDKRQAIPAGNTNLSDSYHTRCPQAKYAQARRLYSEVVYGKPIHTQNRFSPLSKNY